MESRLAADTSTSAGSGGSVELDRAFLRQVADDARAYFPRAFPDVELVLIDVDPNHLHAFWNVPLAVLDAARAQPGADMAPMVLRLVPVAEAAGAGAVAPGVIDVEVGGLQGRTYVGIGQNERRYRAVLGLRTDDDRLIALATSNEVVLPATGPAADPTSGAGAGDAFAPLFDLEAVLPLSSHILAGERVAFEATAELHIHGRAEPGATIRLFGRTVPLRPDGSFSVVQVLPHNSRLLSALLAAAAEPDGPA
jgi:hypothetical protein